MKTIKIAKIIITFLAAFFLVWILAKNFGLGTLLLLEPKIYSWSSIQEGQIIQRRDRGFLSLKLSGHVGLRAHSVEVAIAQMGKEVILEKDWKLLEASPKWSYFEGTVPVSPGWLKIFARSKGTGYRRANSIQIGIGEVFIVAGQSNALGTAATLFIAKSQKVRVGQVQRNGKIVWKSGDDPQILNGGGSVWPLVGDRLVEQLNVPIGFINVAKSNTSIRDWQPGQKNFQRLLKVIEISKPYGARAILWHQGESDQEMNTDEYYSQLSTLIQKIQKMSKLKIPWMVASTTYAYHGKISEHVKAAQKRTWENHLALQGPDTDVFGELYRRDGVHFNEVGTRQVAKLWFEKIHAAFFSESL